MFDPDIDEDDGEMIDWDTLLPEWLYDNHGISWNIEEDCDDNS